VRQRINSFLFCFLLLGSAAFAQVPQPGSGNTARVPAAEPRGPLPVFAFHSSFWVNLHHVLYEQARLRSNRPVMRTQPGQGKAGNALLALEGLSEQERRAWADALEEYERSLAGHDLLFDQDMVLMNNRLAEMGDRESAAATGFLPGIIAALGRAAPIYRVHWWPEDDRANRAWIEGVAPLVEQMGEQIARQLSTIYQAPWPSSAIRVDVCFYAGLFGGYTTLAPLHITVSSRDPRNQGMAALELLFHEASHGMADAVRGSLDREFRALDKPIPRDLWHALLFYTTGEVVRRMLASSGHTAYQPYAQRNGLFVRDWQGYEQALERDWRPYLENRVDFSTSIRRLANDL
jgi:hypothetical protein